MGRFHERVALVTGASRGLGRAIALAFAAEGAEVIVGYKSRQDDAERTLAGVRERGARGAICAFDVSDRAAVEKAIDSLPPIDVLVNCAGVTRDQRFPMLEAADVRECIDVNLLGAFHTSRALVRSMIARRRGAIVNVASIAGIRASPGQVAYAASKGGLLAMTTTMASELASHGVRVNAVVPGMFAAGMASRLDHRVRDMRLAQIPLGRFGEPDELARAVLFLASDDASYVVGQALVVDGGITT